MKICFILQRRFAALGHAMICNIARDFPGTEFCAFVQTRESYDFLRGQKDISYTSLLLEEDIHTKLFDEIIDEEYLRTFEKSYGIPNLWPYLYVDRVLMRGQLVRDYPHEKPILSLEEMRKRMQVTAKELTAFLDREKPDVLVASVVGSLGTFLLYSMAQKRGIQTITMDLIRVKNYVSFTENYRTFTAARDRFNKIQNGDQVRQERQATEFLKNFRSKPEPYLLQFTPGLNKKAYRKEQLQFLYPRRLFASVWWHLRAFVRDLNRRKRRDFMDVYVWWTVWDKMMRKVRAIRGFTHFYSEADFKTRFAFFPLHFEPEVSISLLAPYYTNQIELIRATAHALPFDMLLYVKEHPGMMGYRTHAYYREIVKIPNVRLIDPGVSGTDLAARAALTVTISGTGGWESILLKKPVITFGDVFYNDIPGVEQCRSLEELPHIIKKQLTEWQHDETALIQYICALLETSVPVDFVDLWYKSESYDQIANDEGLKQLSGALAKKMGL